MTGLAQNQNTRVQKVITFTPTLFQMANRKAKNMGVGFPEYVRYLLLNDIKVKLDNEIYIVSSKTDESLEKSFIDIKNENYTVLNNDDDIDNLIESL